MELNTDLLSGEVKTFEVQFQMYSKLTGAAASVMLPACFSSSDSNTHSWASGTTNGSLQQI